MENKTTRLYWIDTLKAIGIFFVLLGHKLESRSLISYIYAFHVPLFFFISGYLFDYDKYRNPKYFLKHKLRTLIIPYFCFAMTSYLFWLIVIRSLSIRGQSLALDPIKPLAGIFYASGIQGWEIPLNIALWFIPCLFVTEAFFWIIQGLIKRRLLLYLSSLVFMGTVGFVGGHVLHTRLPWSIDVAFSAYVFFGMGYLFKEQTNTLLTLSNISGLKKGFFVLLSLILLIIHTKVALLNGKADMYANYYGNILYFYLAALSGIGFYMIMSSWIPQNWVSNFIGRNTIIIIGLCGNGLFIILGLNYLVNKSVGISDSLSLWHGGLYSILQIAVLFPVIYIINKHLPFIIGRSK